MSMGSSPFVITARRDYVDGYAKTVCIECSSGTDTSTH